MYEELNYVLVTPARNEEQHIEKLINSVVSQTVLPVKWIVVSDGSTDRTDDIVKNYESAHAFIKLIRSGANSSRDFSSKVYAIREGVDHIKRLTYDFIGITDADISFDSDFIERLIKKMNGNPKQGIGGGVIHEENSGRWMPFPGSFAWSVSGAMQMFRKECYDEIGGYLPLRRGGIDMIAEVMARMKGWSVQTFEDLSVFHYRKMGSVKGGTLTANFRRGIMEYINGYHPVFQFIRFITRIPSSPVFLASLFRSSGYLWALINREKMVVPDDVVRYLRKEQIRRTIGFFVKFDKKA